MSNFKLVLLGAGLMILFAFFWFLRPFFHGTAMYFYKSPLTTILTISLIAFLMYALKKRDNPKPFKSSVENLDDKKPLTSSEEKSIQTEKLKTTSPAGSPTSLLARIIFTLFILIGFSGFFKLFLNINLFPILIVLAVFFFILVRLKKANITLFIFAIIFFIVVIFLAFAESELRYLATSQDVTFESRTELPKMDIIRTLPHAVATRFAEDSLQNPQEQLRDSQMILVNNTLVRVFPRVPNGPLLYLTKKLSGVITIDSSVLEKKANIEDQQFIYSEGIGIFDNLYYQLHKKKYFVEYKEPIYLKDPERKEWVTVVPYIGYKSFPIRIPYWAGFMIVKGDGTITDYTTQDAEQLQVTKGNRVFPKELARYYTQSYAYKQGLFNKWFLHKNQPEIDEYWDEPQPFHVHTVEGYKQLIFTKPYGRSYGIFKIFIYDATNGKRELIEFSTDTLLIGPIASTDYVTKEFPTIDYTQFKVIEPRPIMANGELYWLVSVVSYSNAGISKSIVVNAKMGKATELKSLQEIQSFAHGSTLQSEDIPLKKDPELTAKEEANEDHIKKQINILRTELDKLEKLIGDFD